MNEPNPRKAPTLKDVAQHAGVSIMAASVVLNGAKSGTRVSHEKRTRILEAATELGYRANTLARALVTRRTNQIALYNGFGYFSLKNPFLAEVVEGLHQGCERHAKDLLIHGSFRQKTMDEVFGSILGGSIDGLVAVSPGSDPLVRRLAVSRLPVVALADEIEGVPSVLVDDASGMEQLGDFLASRGYRRIVFHAAPVEHETVRTRHEALKRSTDRNGVEFVLVKPEDWNEKLTESERDLLVRRDGSRRTAVVCWNDQEALAMIQACRRLGLRIPEDVAVAGFDGFASTWPLLEDLTTVVAPWFDAASTAIDLLVNVLEGEEVPGRTVLPIQLRIGSTT